MACLGLGGIRLIWIGSRAGLDWTGLGWNGWDGMGFIRLFSFF